MIVTHHLQDDIDVSVIAQKLTPLLCSSELKVRVNAGKIAARVVLAVKGPYLQPFTTNNATQVRTSSDEFCLDIVEYRA